MEEINKTILMWWNFSFISPLTNATFFHQIHAISSCKLTFQKDGEHIKQNFVPNFSFRLQTYRCLADVGYPLN